MNTRAQIRMLADGRRVHMHDGPIDLIVEAFGEASEVKRAYLAAAERFVTVLDELCAELSLLRQPTREESALPEGAVARRMMLAVRPHAARDFITAMAAVAGAVAEELLETMTASAALTRAYVNDGGDIALHFAPGEKFVVGMAEYEGPSDPTFRETRNVGHPQSLFGTTTITFDDPIRGIATSGWRGRSFSLGIADAVTVLAETAAMADAGATMIANAVDLPESPKIVRRPACNLAPDSDLGERLVTQAVAPLSPDEIKVALDGGVRKAKLLRAAGLIQAAAIHLQDETKVVGAIGVGAIAVGTSGSLLYNSAAAGSLIHA